VNNSRKNKTKKNKHFKRGHQKNYAKTPSIESEKHSKQENQKTHEKLFEKREQDEYNTHREDQNGDKMKIAKNNDEAANGNPTINLDKSSELDSGDSNVFNLLFEEQDNGEWECENFNEYQST